MKTASKILNPFGRWFHSNAWLRTFCEVYGDLIFCERKKKEPIILWAFGTFSVPHTSTLLTVIDQATVALLCGSWTDKMRLFTTYPDQLQSVYPALPLHERVVYSLVQWNWFSVVTGCTWVTCIQWRQRTNFTAPGCIAPSGKRLRGSTCDCDTFVSLFLLFLMLWSIYREQGRHGAMECLWVWARLSWICMICVRILQFYKFSV